MWSRMIEEFLDKITDTIPGDGMLGEVYYWRDLSKLLDGMSLEVKSMGVEICI